MADQVQPPSSGINLFDAWKEYQRIAMHFNDLLMRLRSQSLAAIGALASVAGFAFKGEAGAAATNWHALTAAFAALSVFWVAIWALDFLYYNRLLLGAVRALISIENASAQGVTTLDSLQLSHEIEAAVATRRTRSSDPQATPPIVRDSRGRWSFYALVFSVLVTGLAVSIWNGRTVPAPAPLLASPTVPRSRSCNRHRRSHRCSRAEVALRP